MTESTNEAIYGQFHIGETVQIIELQTEKYNDELAEVVGPYLIDTERWPVQLYNDKKGKLAIKPANLKRVMPIIYKPSYSTGIYGGYNIHKINTETEKKTNIRKYNHNALIQRAVSPMRVPIRRVIP
eukprot:5028_1